MKKILLLPFSFLFKLVFQSKHTIHPRHARTEAKAMSLRACGEVKKEKYFRMQIGISIMATKTFYRKGIKNLRHHT